MLGTAKNVNRVVGGRLFRAEKPGDSSGGKPGSSVMKAPGGGGKVGGAKRMDSGWWGPGRGRAVD